MSTAKSMANQYLSAKRAAAGGKSNTLSAIASSQQHRFKSSTSNLASNSISGRKTTNVGAGLRATSMTNLAIENSGTPARLQRPASRNALDSIHNGMNAKYAQVQSKVLLQNIRPQPQQQQQQSKIPASKGDTLTRRPNVHTRSTPSPVKAPNERSAIIVKLKSLQEELDRNEQEREALKQELERERADKLEQLQQLKLELQDKVAEHDKQSEEYHQKLLEAYELADQNRRAADQVLNESRQRAEESRNKIEELETQLSELKEFVAMKEEMSDKMYELKEQIREERQRYEEQLKSLHQVFENEKISNKNHVFKDHNSNYFSRIKPSLEASSESISVRGCRKCRSGSSQLHKSEQDIYGSKLSTRMQDTAKSAWKSSKKFASSVITGGVNLTGCRKGSSNLNKGQSTFKQQVLEQSQLQQQQLSEQLDDREQEHTSVVQVNSAQPDEANDQSSEVGAQQQHQDSSMIRVDASRKLTIVTKFNDDQPALLRRNETSTSPVQSIEMASSSGGSDRSRCESSSSGRGTSSEVGSAASQDGDDKEEPAQKASDMKMSGGESGETVDKPQVVSDKRTHKRRASSSLFKASKVVFGGSQASLNKLKNFFNGNAKHLRVQQQQQQQQQQQVHQEQTADGEQHQVSDGSGEIADAENSRLRCMELNQAIKVPSITSVQSKSSAAKACPSEDPSGASINKIHNEDNTSNEFVPATPAIKVEVGQGESESERPQLKQQAASVVCCQ